MTPEEEVEYYREVLEVGVKVISDALGLSPNHYDRDQADGECYLDCFKDAAKFLTESGVQFDPEEWEVVAPYPALVGVIGEMVENLRSECPEDTELFLKAKALLPTLPTNKDAEI